MRRAFVALVLGLSPGLTQADYANINQRPNMLSMGGAGLAARGTHDSAMLNPAGLADLESSRWNLLPIVVEVPFAVGTFRNSLDYLDTASDDSATEIEKQEAAEDLFSEIATKSLGARLNVNPSYTRPNFHLGFFAEALLDINARIGGFTSDQLIESGDTSVTAGTIVGIAHEFEEIGFQVGTTGKLLFRNSPLVQDQFSVHDILGGLNEDTDLPDQLFGESLSDRNAFAIGIDVGAKYWIPTNLLPPGAGESVLEVLKPAVGFTYQDIGNTRFIGGEEMPKDIQQSLSVGAALHPDWKITRHRFALDLRNLNKQQPFMNKLHMGWEMTVWEIAAFQLGLSQGYLTAGTGVHLPFFQLDLYLSSQEASKHSRNQAQTRLGLQLASSF